MTCRIYLIKDGVWRVLDYWTPTRSECSDWLALWKWAAQAGGWSEWFR